MEHDSWALLVKTKNQLIFTTHDNGQDNIIILLVTHKTCIIIIKGLRWYTFNYASYIKLTFTNYLYFKM